MIGIQAPCIQIYIYWLNGPDRRLQEDIDRVQFVDTSTCHRCEAFTVLGPQELRTFKIVCIAAHVCTSTVPAGVELEDPGITMIALLSRLRVQSAYRSAFFCFFKP